MHFPTPQVAPVPLACVRSTYRGLHVAPRRYICTFRVPHVAPVPLSCDRSSCRAQHVAPDVCTIKISYKNFKGFYLKTHFFGARRKTVKKLLIKFGSNFLRTLINQLAGISRYIILSEENIWLKIPGDSKCSKYCDTLISWDARLFEIKKWMNRAFIRILFKGTLMKTFDSKIPEQHKF